MIRLDKGAETGKMATMHCYLRSLQGVKDPSSTVLTLLVVQLFAGSPSDVDKGSCMVVTMLHMPTLRFD